VSFREQGYNRVICGLLRGLLSPGPGQEGLAQEGKDRRHPGPGCAESGYF
jgi:hypothetical protein